MVLVTTVPGDNWYPELPTIYPPLVIPAAHTRLAVPVGPLTGHEQFEVDVLGLSGGTRAPKGFPVVKTSLKPEVGGARFCF